MKTQRNSRLARVLLAGVVSVIAAGGLASTAAAAVPQRDTAPALSTYHVADGDDYWCYFEFWYPCYDHDRYHDDDWFHHRHRDWDHDHDRDRHGHEHDHDWDYEHDHDHDGH